MRRLPLVVLWGLSLLVLFGIGGGLERGAASRAGGLAVELEQLHQLSARLNEETLRIRFGRSGNYDALTRTVLAAEGRIARLDAGFAASGDGAAPPGWTPYADAFRAKLAAVEDFKSSFAILRNSLDYLPGLVDEIEAVETAEAQGCAHAAADLEREVFRYTRRSTPEGVQRISSRLERVAGEERPVSTRSAWANLEAHARSVVRRTEQTGALISTVLNTPTKPAHAALAAELGARLQAENRRSDRLRAGLLALVLALSAYGVWAMVRLGGLADALRGANEELEDKVAVRTAELREKAADLEVAGRHKSEFLARMSHELRTPLNAIIGYSEILIEDAEETGADPQVVADLGRIRGAGKNLLELINDVLDLSKIEAGRLEVVWEDVAVTALVEEVAALGEPLAAANGNRLVVSIAPDTPALHSDSVRLRQILLNLLSNACKFTRDGTVTLAVGPATDGLDVAFSVSDTGIGLSADQIARIFEPFQQGDASTTRKYGGTGLGLAISRRLAHLLQGSLQVESRPAEGSTFALRVPRDRRHRAARYLSKPLDAVSVTGALQGLQGQIGGRRALVVDDHRETRELLKRQLERGGWVVQCAAHGAEGLELLEATTPDLIILDLEMPVLNGFEFLALLRSRPEGENLPVVVITALDLDARVTDRLAQVAHGVLQKEGMTGARLLSEIQGAIPAA